MSRLSAPVRFLIAFVLLAMAWSGCGRSTPVAAPSDGLKRYPLTGEVVSADLTRNVLLVQHEPVPGLMPMAMTMEFPVGPGDAAIAKPGSRIRGTLVELKPGEFRLEQIWPDDPLAKARIDAGLKDLQQDTFIRGKGAYREIGESMPNFTMYDQDGRLVDATTFAGKRVLLDFIYTRCPFPTMCPAATLKMMATQKAAREAGITDLQLVSVTLDPDFDTPGVLRTYAADRAIDTSNFSFITGPLAAVQNLMKQMGVDAVFEGDLLKHSLSTILFDSKGRIIHRTMGSQWEPADFLDKLKRG